MPILQETLTKFGRPVQLDTVVIRGGRIRYQAHPAAGEGEGIGELDFRRIDGRLTGLRWSPDGSAASTATLTLRGALWGIAPTAITVRGPMGSRRPAAVVDLVVGSMPMITANAIATPLSRLDVK